MAATVRSDARPVPHRPGTAAVRSVLGDLAPAGGHVGVRPGLQPRPDRKHVPGCGRDDRGNNCAEAGRRRPAKPGGTPSPVRPPREHDGGGGSAVTPVIRRTRPPPEPPTPESAAGSTSLCPSGWGLPQGRTQRFPDRSARRGALSWVSPPSPRAQGRPMRRRTRRPPDGRPPGRVRPRQTRRRRGRDRRRPPRNLPRLPPPGRRRCRPTASSAGSGPPGTASPPRGRASRWTDWPRASTRPSRRPGPCRRPGPSRRGWSGLPQYEIVKELGRGRDGGRLPGPEHGDGPGRGAEGGQPGAARPAGGGGPVPPGDPGGGQAAAPEHRGRPRRGAGRRRSWCWRWSTSPGRTWRGW